jgi:hypothetical protein
MATCAQLSSRGGMDGTTSHMVQKERFQMAAVHCMLL